MRKKIFVLLSLFVMILCAAFFLLKSDPKKQASKALAQLRDKNYSEAELLIDSLPSRVDIALYKGYLEQVKGRLDLAERFLASAWSEAKKNGSPNEVVAEIALARASNAYFTGNDERCIECIQVARELAYEGPGMPFFDGLEHYLRQSYEEAVPLWSGYLPADLDDWLVASVEVLFPKSWQNLHLAHALLEEGDILRGRELLEKESRLADIHSEHLPPINLFLGYSYLKESRKVACVDRSSFYRLAHFYFERSHLQKLFDREKNRIATHVESEAATLLLTDREDKREEGLGFVHILQGWECGMATHRLSALLVENILNHRDRNNFYLCQAVRQQFQGSLFLNLLSDKMLSSLAQELKVGETENLFYLWELLEQLSLAPKQAAKEIATLAAAEIFETIKGDDPALTKTCHFMAFWEKLGRSDLERERMARDLLIHAKLFWNNERQEKKGERLMEIALKITNHDPQIAQEIESFLSTLYVQAENSNMIRRLTLIYEAMEHFEINRQGLISKTTIANHLADAEYLFEARNYLAARRHANWVLKLEPDNQGARRLAGLSSFHLRDYSKAICHLQLLVGADEESDKALALSLAFASPIQHHLCKSLQLDEVD